MAFLIIFFFLALTTLSEWVVRTSQTRATIRTARSEAMPPLGQRSVMSLSSSSPSLNASPSVSRAVAEIYPPKPNRDVKHVTSLLRNPAEAIDPRRATEGLKALKRNEYNVRRVPGPKGPHETKPSLAGPLCVFVPANAFDDLHAIELWAALETWSDNSTMIFTDSSSVAPRAVESADRTGAAVAEAKLDRWNNFHFNIVLGSPELQRRGATADSIRGRGQLSIPLFHWISQLVKRDDPLVQNCKWFMKCDTDTYLRRGLLEREVLNKLDHTKPYHVGVPLKFNTRPYHHTFRQIEFDYNIGGPGYTFSRGLMDSVDIFACVKSMVLDPVLLIHDDVATGYCATYHSGKSRLVYHHTAAAATHSAVIHRLLLGPQAGSPATNNRPHETSACVAKLTSIHPVNPNMMRLLRKDDREREEDHPKSSTEPFAPCEVSFMAGVKPVFAPGWAVEKTDPDLHLLSTEWLLLTARDATFLNATKTDTDFVLRERRAQGAFRRVIG